MAAGISVELFIVRPCGPGRCYVPPIDKRAFDLSSHIQQVDSISM
jgi:hypothetical protein